MDDFDLTRIYEVKYHDYYDQYVSSNSISGIKYPDDKLKLSKTTDFYMIKKVDTFYLFTVIFVL